MDELTTIFHGANEAYVRTLYDQYLQDPQAVEESMRTLFSELPRYSLDVPAPSYSNGHIPAAATVKIDLDAACNVVELARTIRGRGHLAATLDPLDKHPGITTAFLSAQSYNLSEQDLDSLPASIVGGPVATTARTAGEAIASLRAIYERTTGYDYGHVHDENERAWLRDAVETSRFNLAVDAAHKTQILQRLTQIEAFEKFLHTTFRGQKRFSIEGTDMLVPMLDEILQAAATAGTSDIIMGMSHRGRLNVLAHILEKPYKKIFTEFREAAMGEGPAPTEGSSSGWTGDVKYHMGASGSHHGAGEARMSLTLANNPSHLEFVDPVIEGMARAMQDRRDHPGSPTQDITAALPILMHGDAAFPGEGVVAETLNLSRLHGYETGGTIHFILNNKIGFTTESNDSRSTLYASDLAKGYEIPVIHVNSDDVEACLAVARMAYAYRERFKKDILIDLIGYRRWGHNEGDEPSYTQPQLYDTIAAHPSVRAVWAQQLTAQNIVKPGEPEALLDIAVAHLRDVNGDVSIDPVRLERRGIIDDAITGQDRPTGVAKATLVKLGRQTLSWPESFTPQARLAQQLERRRTALVQAESLDWAMAESLSLASIVSQGTPVRLTGQDTERGTFSQRHLVLHDTHSGLKCTPLQLLREAKATFAIYNSPLSEVGALGFEYGYSVVAPNTLVIWEAQFGDFVNAGQVIVDQFIAAGAAKWRQRSSLVLLLPHGYEGQGPEHSSGRLERFLQLAAGGNLWVTNPSTPAQYFHLLRRQALLLHIAPRPLVVMTPKSLLRKPEAASPFVDFISGSFQTVLDDSDAASRRSEVSRLVLCSGKLFYDLIASPERQSSPSVAIARVEELYPFPEAKLAELLAHYPRLTEVIWAQEEPKNMGAWTYIQPRLQQATAQLHIVPDYVGRPERASPAVGSASMHRVEQEKIVSCAFKNVRVTEIIGKRG